MLGIFVKTHNRKRVSSHLLVVLQAVSLLACCVPVHWQNTGPAWFLLLCLVGAVLGVWTLFHNTPANFAVYPEVRLGAALVTGGPYRMIRHPMYTALVVMMVGISGYNGHWINYAGVLGILIAVVVKSQREEQYLQQLFPQYAEYQGHTARFVPFIY